MEGKISRDATANTPANQPSLEKTSGRGTQEPPSIATTAQSRKMTRGGGGRGGGCVGDRSSRRSKYNNNSGKSVRTLCDFTAKQLGLERRRERERLRIGASTLYQDVRLYVITNAGRLLRSTNAGNLEHTYPYSVPTYDFQARYGVLERCRRIDGIKLYSVQLQRDFPTWGIVIGTTRDKREKNW